MLLPQGRFSEFLHAKAADRQDLLVELLAFGVYNLIGQQARRRGDLARERLRTAQRARQGLADASEEAEKLAAARVRALADLARGVEERLRGNAASSASRRTRQPRRPRPPRAMPRCSPPCAPPATCQG